MRLVAGCSLAAAAADDRSSGSAAAVATLVSASPAHLLVAA